MRFVAATTFAIALTLASAFVLYAESTATRRLASHVQGQERARDRLEDEISALRAERAWLGRPSRIEPAARALGMRPALERRYTTLSDLARAQAAAVDPSTTAPIHGAGDGPAPLSSR